ncbi:MAG: NERD domain-containing protein [Patescibacteria group bacterium]|nr:NERD domain-containing protein [Patescibacteria group bacterium]MDD5294813.1 NERD domain-containing protein [Patescibacteria group bacterium]MDD5554553.1 NERD domain-containing protein [Patescibacteria group bacterium]
MPNNYLKSKIRNYELYRYVIVVILILFAYFAGRYFFFNNNLSNFVVGLVLGAVGVFVLFIIEYCINRQDSYGKGLNLETQIENKLKKLWIKYVQHIETVYGDLDFLITKGNSYYGVEAKNWAGNVMFNNGSLYINGFDNTDILIALLKHCKLVRNLKFGENPNKFVKPMLVFGYKTVVNIPQNKIKFNNNVEIIVTTIKDFDQYIK